MRRVLRPLVAVAVLVACALPSLLQRTNWPLTLATLDPFGSSVVAIAMDHWSKNPLALSFTTPSGLGQ
jgi:uncharacterized lipoprotein YajG